MNGGLGRKMGATVVLLLAVVAVWGQPGTEEPISLTGRFLAGFGEVREGQASAGGPVATVDADLAAFWINPRVLKVEFSPTMTFGRKLPETNVGGAGNGFSASATILGGSHFPLRLSYSRLGQDSLSSETRGTLAGVETSTSTRSFSANWQLVFPHFPTAQFEYRSTGSDFELPNALGGDEQSDSKTLSGKLQYRWWGWQMDGLYLRSHSRQTSPHFEVLGDGMLRDAYTQKELRFNATRSLPLHSGLSLALERDNWNYDLAALKSENKVQSANAAVTSQPFARVTTTLEARYISDLLASQLQQALFGESVVGGSNTVPLALLPVRNGVTSFDAATQVRLGAGFWLHGGAGTSHASGGSESVNWSGGLSYQRKLRSGFVSADYSRSHDGTRTGINNLGFWNTAANVAVGALFSRTIKVQTGTVSFSHEAPARLKFSTSAHLSQGTLEERGITYPNHEYGEQISLSRLLGRWNLTGSFNFDKNTGDYVLLRNKNMAKSFGLSAQSRGLQFSVRRQYNDGLALQVGDSFIWISSPQAVSPLLARLNLNSTASTTMTGAYQPGRGRLTLMGTWGRFSYTANGQPQTNYSLLNVSASYRLRRLNLIAGYMRQSQSFSIGPLSNFERRRIYFQVERRFRLL